jgi:hypothetical protein
MDIIDVSQKNYIFSPPVQNQASMGKFMFLASFIDSNSSNH